MSEFVDPRTNSKVDYCQGFNFIAAFALHFLAEEEAFWYFFFFTAHFALVYSL